MLIGSTKLNRHTGDEVDQKINLTVSLILLNLEC
jgi:hypothetical protein